MKDILHEIIVRKDSMNGADQIRDNCYFDPDSIALLTDDELMDMLDALSMAKRMYSAVKNAAYVRGLLLTTPKREIQNNSSNNLEP